MNAAANPLTNSRALTILEERLAVLDGTRGDPQRAALRVADIAALRALLASLSNRANVLAAEIGGLEAEIAVLASDIAALNAALPLIDDRMTAAEVVTFAVQTSAPTATGDSVIFQI